MARDPVGTIAHAHRGWVAYMDCGRAYRPRIQRALPGRRVSDEFRARRRLVRGGDASQCAGPTRPGPGGMDLRSRRAIHWVRRVASETGNLEQPGGRVAAVVLGGGARRAKRGRRRSRPHLARRAPRLKSTTREGESSTYK